MSRRLIPVLFLCAVSLAVTACVGDPWVDTRREAGIAGGRAGASTQDRVAICHAPGESAKTLLDMAAAECAKTKRTPSYAGTMKWQCRLLSPHRSYFDCK